MGLQPQNQYGTCMRAADDGELFSSHRKTHVLSLFGEKYRDTCLDIDLVNLRTGHKITHPSHYRMRLSLDPQNPGKGSAGILTITDRTVER